MKNIHTFESFLNENLNEGKISLADFYEKNIDKHNTEKSFVSAAIKMGFKEADVEQLLGNIEQGGDSYLKLSADVFNEGKLVGDEWKAWLDIEEAIRGIYIKYNKKVDPKKISEFIQEHVDEYKMVGPTLK
jgi:hypothetical protein